MAKLKTPQNTPNSISSKMTVMGTPSSQAMMGISFSFNSRRHKK